MCARSVASITFKVKTEEKHKKLAAKSTGHTYQWQILQNSDIPESEIPKFADAQHWLEYFPPMAIADMKSIGFKVDWRRSFITTPANAYYDSFVRWQFMHLKEKDKIRFGKRYSIYSPKDGQACMDHDRSKGEGVGPQDYTGIKLKVVDPSSVASLAKISAGKNVYLVAATLRPETMYGQTNCWVSPTITYIAFAINDNDVYVTTRRAARNMSYQVETPDGAGIKGYTKPEGTVDVLGDVPGMDLMGCKLSAPNAKYDHVYALPLLTIKENMGTGVVTCVPSDAPDDFAGLRDLKKKAALRDKYGIADEMVLPFDPVPIIDIPGYSNLCAEKACDDLKVISQNDAVKLAEAKDICYKKGFYDGIMMLGSQKGKKVEVAKDLVRAEMIASGDAVVYKEPEKLVVSRSNDECVVALCDQWYLIYGEKTWRAEVEGHLHETLNTYDPATTKKFEATLDWLHEHACSRSYGLGSRFPWDEKYLIESLSDSTIYMAYYTVAHLLHEGTLDGVGGGPLGIKPEDMTREVWDFVFFGTAVPAACAIKMADLETLRNEFQYFYPMNLRVSGKDLVQNHLTYSLYNHCAIFPKEMWPKAIRANGHLMLNAEKMSKSTGNFLTLEQCVEKYTADATRMCLADAGDSLEDANFEFKSANAMILTICRELEWTEETLKTIDTLRVGPMSTFGDKAFLSAINEAIGATDAAYDKMHYREARKVGYNELQGKRNWYRDYCSATGEGMHRDLLVHFITIQWLLMSPIIPHTAEKVWGMLGHKDSVLDQPFPVPGHVDTVILKALDYLADATHTFRVRIQNMSKKKGKKGAAAGPPPVPTKGTIFVAAEYPEWQRVTLSYLDEHYDAATNDFPDNRSLLPELKKLPELADKKVFKNVMPFISFVRAAMAEKGRDALASVLPFDETATLVTNVAYLQKALKLEEVTIKALTDCTDAKLAMQGKPGDPVSVFEA